MLTISRGKLVGQRLGGGGGGGIAPSGTPWITPVLIEVETLVQIDNKRWYCETFLIWGLPTIPSLSMQVVCSKEKQFHAIEIWNVRSHQIIHQCVGGVIVVCIAVLAFFHDISLKFRSDCGVHCSTCPLSWDITEVPEWLWNALQYLPSFMSYHCICCDNLCVHTHACTHTALSKQIAPIGKIGSVC